MTDHVAPAAHAHGGGGGGEGGGGGGGLKCSWIQSTCSSWVTGKRTKIFEMGSEI